MRIETETDIDILRQKAGLLQKENDLLHARLAELTAQLDKLQGGDGAALQQELAYLKERLEAQSRALFGKSSEKCKDQAPARPEAAKPERPLQKGHGPREQPKLPVVEQIHELDDADKTCPACGGTLTSMGEQFEEADEIDVVERTFRIVRHLWA